MAYAGNCPAADRRDYGEHLLDDIAEDGSIPPEQIEAGFSGPLPDAGGNNRHRRTGTVGIRSGPNTRRMRERGSMVQIYRLAFGFRVIGIDKDNFGC